MAPVGLALHALARALGEPFVHHVRGRQRREDCLSWPWGCQAIGSPAAAIRVRLEPAGFSFNITGLTLDDPPTHPPMNVAILGAVTAAEAVAVEHATLFALL